MYQDLKGKVALITGSGKKTGIGYAIAGKLASMGTHIIMADLGSLLPDGRQWEEMLGLSREL
ncbi:MAG: SDR family NAD(P)-dependent oxidoreductase, partial [Deltaproteobacteria bacterium]